MIPNNYRGMRSMKDALLKYRVAVENNHPPLTLFDTEFSKEQWRLLYDDKRCPQCGSLLKFPRSGNLQDYAVCWGRRHGDKKLFRILKTKLNGTFKTYGSH